jgi:hypothetical protein
VLYDDGRIACDDKGVIVRWYYLWGRKKIPYSTIRAINKRPLRNIRNIFPERLLTHPIDAYSQVALTADGSQQTAERAERIVLTPAGHSALRCRAFGCQVEALLLLPTRARRRRMS